MTSPTTMSTCPTEETLAAFVDGRLDADARERVIAHLAECSDCRDVVLMASEFKQVESDQVAGFDDDEEPSRVPVVTRRRVLAIPLTIAASVLIAALGALLLWRGSQPRKAMAELVEAGNALPERPIEGRLTDGFAYRPLKPVLRSETAEEPDLALQIAARRAQDAAKVTPSSTQLQAVAVGQLLLGKADAAVLTLESVLLEETKESDVARAIAKSNDPRLLNALTVAFLAQHRSSGVTRATLLASEAAQRSWTLEKTPETAWNRAVATEKLFLWKAAAEAWRDYLRLDPDSEWAVEARSRLERVNSQTLTQGWERSKARAWEAARRLDLSTLQDIARLYPEQMRLAAEDEILARWVPPDQAVTPAQLATNAQAEIVARSLDVSGDSTVSDLVRTAGDPARSSSFAIGYQSFLKAREHYRQSRIADAVAVLASSRHAADGAGLPLSAMHDLLRAGCAYYQNEYASALHLTSSVSRRMDCTRWPSLCGRADWLAGISHASIGQMNEALHSYESARNHYSRIGFRDGELAATGLLASGFELVGDEERGWQLRLRALQMVAAIGRGSTRLPQTLAGAAAAAQRDDLIETSILFCDAVLDATEEPTWADVRHAAYSRRSELYRRRGDSAAGRRDLHAASLVAKTITDRDLQGFATTHPEHLRARLEDLSDGGERQALLAEAFTFAKNTGNTSREIEVLLLRGAEEAGRGDSVAAESTLESALSLIDAQRSKLADLQLRDTYLDQRRDVYRHLARSVAGRGDAAKALHFAERARARTLRERYEGSLRVATPSVEDLRAQLPEHLAVLYLMNTDESLSQWLITRDGIRYHTSSFAAARIEALGSAMLSKDAAQAGQAGTILARELLDPFRVELRQAGTIVFVPDDGLAGVPFAALPIDGRLLLERSRVVVSPSLALLVSCTRRSALAGRIESVVAISPSTGNIAGLDYLPAAEREAEEVIRHFSGTSQHLAGARATRSAILAAAARAEILHFAGHGIFNESHPSYAAIQVSASSEGSLWYAHEIADSRLPAVRLVVLASCEGLRSSARQREGVSSLGRAFLAAGVPAVIGAIRPVEDEVANALFARFYEALARGADAASALREAQLSLRHRYPVRSWGIFQLMGGVA